MILFYTTFTKGYGHINPIAIMNKIDNFDRLLFPIRVRIVDIGPDVGT